MGETIGVIGLGRMGFGIAKNLISRGYQVKGYDVAAPVWIGLKKPAVFARKARPE